MIVYYQRYAVWIADHRRRSDYVTRVYATRAAAERDARRRNEQFLRGHPGLPPLRVPLAYVAAVRVIERGKAAS